MQAQEAGTNIPWRHEGRRRPGEMAYRWASAAFESNHRRCLGVVVLFAVEAEPNADVDVPPTKRPLSAPALGLVVMFDSLKLICPLGRRMPGACGFV